jgi:hypothetical protein
MMTAPDRHLVALEALERESPEGVTMLGDGVTPVFRTSARYEYQVIDRTQAKLTAGVPPYYDASQIQADVPQGVFQTGIIDPTGTNGLTPLQFQQLAYQAAGS